MSSSWDSLAADIRRGWHEQADQDGAIELACSLAAALEETDELGSSVTAVSTACDCLWDSDLTVEACSLADIFRTGISDSVGFAEDAESVWLRLQALLLSARAEHRAGHAMAALAYAVEGRRLLISHLGGYDGFRSALDAGARGENCDDVCGVLSIAIPAARVLSEQHSSEMAEHWLRQLTSEALRLTINGRHEPSGEHAYALVNQLLMAILARRQRSDRPVIQLLVGLDGLLRPSDPRSYATRRLVDMALARWDGDLQAERRIAKLAVRDLLDARLNRHVRMLTERGHFPPRPQTV